MTATELIKQLQALEPTLQNLEVWVLGADDRYVVPREIRICLNYPSKPFIELVDG